MRVRARHHMLVIVGLLGIGLAFAGAAAAQDAEDTVLLATPLNANPPTSPVRLIFVHHSTGGNWLADPAVDESTGGDLGRALMNNNYYVSATNYGWGPYSIGDMTDIGHWWVWFRGDDYANDVAALYAESGQNFGDFGSWPRLATAPTGGNTVIMLKSCFPNSHILGSPNDPPTVGENPMRGEWAGSETYTVGNAKGIYNDILEYFETRQDKLFILITPPPLQESETSSSAAANARALNNWLVNDWLDGYNYHNVAVFDFFTVLTSNGGSPTSNDLGSSAGNHHRYRNGAIEHITTKGSNYCAYPSGDSHPTAAGGQKASGEYVPLLNIFYHCWKGDGGCPGQASGCTLSCSATVPTSAAVGASVSLASSATPSGCTGTVTYDWDFGDGSAHATTQNATHVYSTAATYTWRLRTTVQGVTCERTGSIVVSAATTCTLTCQASATPTSGTVPLAVTFSSSATTTNCTGSVTNSWDFGDGSTHATTQNATHTYTAAGTYTWTFTATIAGKTCSKTGTVTVSAQPGTDEYGYIVPSVAHSTGTAGTNWRSDVAVVAGGDGPAALHLTFYDASSGAGTPATRTLQMDSTAEYRDILTAVFGFASSASVNGTLQITSNQPLVVTSRTYNQESATRTYGQYYPALIVEYPGGRGVDAIFAGDNGILSGLKKNSAYRTNVGIVNLSPTSCTVNFQLINASGTEIGTVRQLTAAGRRWKQENDIFAKVGAGNQEIAYARVQVQTEGCSVWAYASVIDQNTGDPTTIPVLLP